jgi:hypothetical protein
MKAYVTIREIQRKMLKECYKEQVTILFSEEKKTFFFFSSMIL